MVFMTLKRESLVRQSKASSHQCLGNCFTKELIPSTLWPIPWWKFQLFWQWDTAAILLMGSGGTRNCSKGWGQTGGGTPADKAADGQTRCMEQLPGWEALLHEPVLTQQPSSRLGGRQRHSGTELLAPSGLQGPPNRAFSAERRKKKSHSANFLHFLFFLKHMCLRLYRLMCMWEGWWRISSRQLALPATGDGAPSHISWCWDWCISSSPLLPFWCKGQHCIWLLHKPCKSHQHSSLNVFARSQQLWPIPCYLKYCFPPQSLDSVAENKYLSWVVFNLPKHGWVQLCFCQPS